MRFYIENFGCRATQADGAALERQFLDKGMERAGAARDAELVVLNTCTVTAGADKDARASIRRLQRSNPGCRILVTGCYAQRAPQELAALPGVTWVVGNSHKHRAAEIVAGSLSAPAGFVSITELTAKADGIHSFNKDRETAGQQAQLAPPGNVVVGDIFAHTELMAAPVFEAANERTRPNLKVQDGCDNRCSFCVIPYVRGASRSLPLDRVIEEVGALVATGYREVVISGINLGRWGRDLEASSQFSVFRPQNGQSENRQASTVGGENLRGSSTLSSQPTNPERRTSNEQRLVHLIRAILEGTSLEKLRISSVEPMDWSDELIELVASSPRIAKHAHVPMQSGSDAVLRRMHRKYRPWHYREKVLKIREAMPCAAIGADVMVGFPGESEAEFAETRRMIEELPFTYLHVFTYSARPGTPAAEQPGQVPVAVARERNAVLRKIAAAKKAAFMQSLIGSEVEAITLQTGGTNFTEALTENYLKVKIHGHYEANRWMNVVVEGVKDEMMIGLPTFPTASKREAADSCAPVVTREYTTGNNCVDLP
ncbi:MAG: MiaB/RimO family radical SAM methylthiotransferase [Terriglobales bacterium]